MKIFLCLLIALLCIAPVGAVIYVPPAGATGAVAGEASIFSWISQTASSASAGLDQVYDGLVAIGTYLQTIPTQIFYGIVALMMGLFFPLVDAFNFMYSDANMLYTAVAPVCNLFLNAPQWSLGFIYNWTPSHTPTITASAESSISTSAVYTAWVATRQQSNTLYAIASVTLLLLSITLSFSLRAARFIIWLYNKIPGKAT